MKKRLGAVLLTVFILMLTGCGNSNSAEDPAGADIQMIENTGQTEENAASPKSQTIFP